MRRLLTLALLMGCIGVLSAQTITAYNYTNCICITTNDTVKSCSKQNIRTYYYGTEDKNGNFHSTGSAPAQIGAVSQLPVTNVLRKNGATPGIAISFTTNEDYEDAALADMGNPPFNVMSIQMTDNEKVYAIALPQQYLNTNTCELTPPGKAALLARTLD